MVPLAEPVLGEAECRGEYLERFALGALAYDEDGGGFLSQPAELGDGDDEVGGRGVRVVRPVEQFLGADDEVLGDVADGLLGQGRSLHRFAWFGDTPFEALDLTVDRVQGLVDDARSPEHFFGGDPAADWRVLSARRG
ncbi:hypothetical protein ABZ905_28215 [Streptomyces parvus]|uniref:hypothetical protein n=1 Tax=Streptomyces parvus TaxID=66428 RepID=UPI0033DA6E96